MDENNLTNRIEAEDCPDCGARRVGGREGCAALFDQITFQELGQPGYGRAQGYGRTHRLLVDAYCMQHLDKYCRSAKSYAAHLTGLCCGVEYHGDPKIYAAIQRWLNGRVDLQKPETLAFLGKLTLADVRPARDAEEHIRLVQAWAGSAWEAYSVQHELARAWIRAALGA